MKKFTMRLIRLLFGLFLYSLGIVTTINANIGYAPWDVFHVGLANTASITIGMASIATGVVIGIIALLLGEKLGLGTVLNMVLIGVFMDIIISWQVIPKQESLLLGSLMMVGGLFIISLASYFYMGARFSAGPRDSLMVALTKKTGLSVGLCRGALEILAVITGWWLGGKVGVGTILSAMIIGLCVQTTFKLLKFDASKIQHETIDQTFKSLIKPKLN